MTYDHLTLAFTGKWSYLESDFADYHFRESIKRVRIAIVVAVLFYAGFGILDSVIAPDKKELFWIIRYAVVCPFATLVFIFSFRPGFIKWAQQSLFIMCLIGGLGIEAMVIIADPPATYSYYAGIILIFITIFTFLRMRFLWASTCSWLIVFCYEIGALYIADTPGTILINNNFFFVSANIFCMLAGYSIELNERRSFFYNVCLEIEKEKVLKVNEELDLRVKERTRELSDANARLNREMAERLAAEQAKLQMEKELDRKKRLESIGTLAGGIAHDFNNILVSVIMYSELTLEMLDRESVEHENVKQILDAGIRARDLTRQILTFSQDVEKKLVPVQPGKIVTEVLKLLKASIPAGIEILYNIKSSSFIMGDEGQLHRVIMNLCTNARQAMTNRRGTLFVSVEDTVIRDDFFQDTDSIEPGSYVKLAVGDTGGGMSSEVVEKIFNPFFTTKSSGEGTGLGLSVVHGIVKQFGGNIKVYSEPGHGTTFMLFFPVI